MPIAAADHIQDPEFISDRVCRSPECHRMTAYIDYNRVTVLVTSQTAKLHALHCCFIACYM